MGAWWRAIQFVRMKQQFLLTVMVGVTVSTLNPAHATEPPPPKIDSIVVSGPQKNLRVAPSPGAEAYYFYSATNPSGPFLLDTNFALAPYITGYTTNVITNGLVIITNLAYEWRNTNFAGDRGFFRMSATAMSSNQMALATVLNRLAYGPTPDLLAAYADNPQAYIDEQVNMDGVPETLDETSILEVTNAVPSDPTTNWTYISITGLLRTSSSGSTNLYLYMTQPNEVFVDDLQLVVGTNAGAGPNLLVNGDFESPLAAPWVTIGSAITNAYTTNSVAHSGSSSLRMGSAVAGSLTGHYLRQTITTPLTNNTYVTLSYWYLPSAGSSKLRVQNGNANLVSSPGGIPSTPTWVYAQMTGTADSTPRLYVYLSGAGDCYLDDVKLVAGTDAGVGPNLLVNGDFESPTYSPWTNSTDFANSVISSEVAHSGNGSLHVVATAGGGGSGDSVYQTVPVTSGQVYTLSYWYVPSKNRTLTVRLSGSGLRSTPDTTLAGVSRRLGSAQARVSDYRAWFCQHAVSSPRQLFEVLSQFWENHFVTQWSKSRDYLQGLGFDSTTADILATDWEWREMTKWRNALLNPNCTFYDLLKISAESPAMIVYLDSVNSKGSGNNVANENYARELLELFTFGVDNGYDQNDIIIMSRAWTGWSVELVDPENAGNPFAPASATYYPNTNSTSTANKVGTLAFNFKAGNHGTNRGALFPGKTVPARFGAPWAGASYQLDIPARVTGSTNGIQDGYDVLAHLANQPFTEEFISVKLCRLFVHDGFPNPTTRTDLPEEYAFYDYTNPNRSAEAELVHQCMLAWENSTPKGNIRAVLNTIFNSDLFRSHTANAQKVKTPLEFAASTIRALCGTNLTGGLTAASDGYSFSTPLNRMGGMNLFDRDAPDGYAEDGSPWISAGTVVERIRFVQAFCNAGTGDDAGNSTCDPVGLLKARLPAASWNDAGAVADYFLGILYPAEGAGNLTLYRQAAIDFLNTADNGTTSSPFSAQANTGTTYDARVRGMVAMLMAQQRFQEQ